MPKKTKKVIKVSPYKLTLKLNGQIFESYGETPEETLAGLKVNGYKSKGEFTLTLGEKASKPIVLLVPQLRKLFEGTGMTGNIQRTVLIKKLKSLL